MLGFAILCQSRYITNIFRTRQLSLCPHVLAVRRLDVRILYVEDLSSPRRSWFCRGCLVPLPAGLLGKLWMNFHEMFRFFIYS